MRALARESFSSSASRVEVGGSVLGISKTPVTPPSTAAREPVSRSSFHSMPGSRKCTWVSMTPGSTVSPAASNTASAEAWRRSPMAAMRPSRTPTSARPRPAWLATSPPRTMRSKTSANGLGLFQQRLGGREHALGGEVDHVADGGAQGRVDLAYLLEGPRPAHDPHALAPGPPDAVVGRAEEGQGRSAGGPGQLGVAVVVADEQPHPIQGREGGEQV